MTIIVTNNNRITTVTINRPEVKNAVDGATANLLAEAFLEFDANKDSDIAILTGAGDTFCAGADLKSVAVGAGNKVRIDGNGPLGCTRMVLSKPVIAAVEGYAVAGGIELALWCDLRVAAKDAIFGVFCRRWGVPLVDGGTIRLTRLLGQSHAMDLILTGRGVSGKEANRMGLVNKMVKKGEALNAAIQLAEELCHFPQGCLRSDRMSAITQWNRSLADALADETRYGLEVIRSGETQEGASRFAAGKGRHGDFESI